MKDKIIIILVMLLTYAIGFFAVYGVWHFYLHHFK